jgi:hypothetical protein
METTQLENPIDSSGNIRITSLNRDKTRRTDAADPRYQVYFELSIAPLPVWRTIFRREWKALSQTRPELSLDVNVDNRFLVVHCPLQEVAGIYLPALKKAVDETNKAYGKYADNAEAEHQHRSDIWTEERKAVDDVADSLKFE